MNRLISVFASCKEKFSSITIPLTSWLKGDSRHRKTVDQIRMSKDEKEISDLKLTLPAATISGVFNERNSKGLQAHTSLITLDIDGKDNLAIKDLEELKRRISKLFYILYCGLSASGRGVFCIVQIKEPEKHLAHFFALEKQFADMGIIIDSACKDVTRLRFFSYDDNAYYNPNAVIFDECLEKMSEKSVSVRTERIKRDRQISPPHENNEIIDPMELMIRSPFSNNRYFLPPSANNRQRGIHNLLECAMSKRTDVTADYIDWIFVCSIIAANFGEEGRDLFHDISQFYPNYSEVECDNKYDELLRKKYTPSCKNLEELLNRYGL